MSSVCALIEADGYIRAFPSEPVANCAFALVSYSDYQSLQSGTNLEFRIDSGMYVDVVGYLLLSFVIGHTTGRIAKGLGKA